MKIRSSVFGAGSSPPPAVPSRRTCLFGLGSALALVLAGCAAPPPAVPKQEIATPEPKPPQWRAPRIGLALGGGAARGFAHVGVIEILEQNGIRPDVVVGTSAGSLVAALYASGMSTQELMGTALQMEEAAIADWTLPLFNRGLLRGEALARYVNKQVQGRDLQEMRIPLGILATDLASGKGVLFQRGDTGTAVRASSAVPGVFTPVAIGGRQYVDGGLVAPVPVEQARQMGAELVIGVDISSPPDAKPDNDALSVVLQTFSIMGQSINRHILATADVVVRPELNGVGSADFASRQKSIAAGRQAMQAAMPRLKELMLAKRRLVDNG